MYPEPHQWVLGKGPRQGRRGPLQAGPRVWVPIPGVPTPGGPSLPGEAWGPGSFPLGTPSQEAAAGLEGGLRVTQPEQEGQLQAVPPPAPKTMPAHQGLPDPASPPPAPGTPPPCPSTNKLRLGLLGRGRHRNQAELAGTGTVSGSQRREIRGCRHHPAGSLRPSGQHQLPSQRNHMCFPPSHRLHRGRVRLWPGEAGSLPRFPKMPTVGGHPAASLAARPTP